MKKIKKLAKQLSDFEYELTEEEMKIETLYSIKKLHTTDEQYCIIDHVGMYLEIEDGCGFFAGRMLNLIHRLITTHNINNIAKVATALKNYSNDNSPSILSFKNINNNLIEQSTIDDYFDDFYKSIEVVYSMDNIEKHLHAPFEFSFDNKENGEYCYNITKSLLEIMISEYNIKNKDELISFLKENYNLIKSEKFIQLKEKIKTDNLKLKNDFMFDLSKLEYIIRVIYRILL